LPEPTRNIRLVVEYDGTELSGWQRQENGPTVQQHLEEGLAELHGAPTRVVGASRTDAGVHALGQVVAFETTSRIPTDGYRKGLNAILPRSIAVVEVAVAPAEFSPRFSARGKHYRYALWTRRDRSPRLERFSWHRPFPLDLAAMRTAASHLVGEFDFTSFRASGCTAQTATREITAVDVTRPSDDELVIDVRGNAFLRNMVRILAGTLVDVGEGRIPADTLPRIVAARDRKAAGVTAPARGLTLVEVFYAPDFSRR